MLSSYVALEKHENLTGFNGSMGPQPPSRLNNWISNGNTAINKQ